MKNIFSLFILLISLNSFAQEKINWMTIEEAAKANEKEPRKIVIDVYTDWCGWCKKMDKATFQHPEIAAYVNENYYAVKLNAEQKESITLKDHEYKFVASGRRGYHELAAQLLQGKMSYPSIVYLDEKFNMIQPIPGYMAPKAFEEVINYFAEDHYKTTSFDDFKKSFKSSLSASQEG